MIRTFVFLSILQVFGVGLCWNPLKHGAESEGTTLKIAVPGLPSTEEITQRLHDVHKNFLVSKKNHKTLPVKPEGKTREDSLDLSDPISSSIDELIRRPYGIHTTVYRPKSGHRISSVEDGGVILWKAKDGRSCEHVTVILDREVPGSVIVQFKDSNGAKSWRYFEKSGQEWKTLTEVEFFKRFDERVYRETVLDSITVDIEEKKESKKLIKNISPKLPFRVYVPNVGYRIKTVMDNGRALWEAKSEDERCIHISFYPRDEPTLAYLVVRSSEGIKELFLKKIIELWMDIKRGAYLEELKNGGFNESTFNDCFTLDFTNVDEDVFYTGTMEIGGGTMIRYSSRPGFRMTKILEGAKTVWKGSSGEFCPYFRLITISNDTRLGLVFVSNAKGEHKILYYREVNGKWNQVKKEEFHAPHSNKNDPMYVHKGDGKLIMSSFRNKDGLRIISYSSRVSNSRGDIVMVHGIRSHFKSEFCASSAEWNFEHFGSPTFPRTTPLGGYVTQKESEDVLKYKYIFEHAFTDGMDAFEVSPMYGYACSLVEILNRFGYNVYGFDLQSQGLSESIAVSKCYVNEFKDHVYDVLQFVDIVKRGAFNDSSETYDKMTLFKGVHNARRTILVANSMGGNIAMQAIQEFYKNAEPGTKFVDGFVGIAPMFNLDNHLDTTFKKVTRSFLGLLSWAVPETENPCESPKNYGSSLEVFIRYNDPFYYGKNLAFGTLNSIFEACNEVKKEENMAYYPMNMPTILIHSTDDYICDVRGSREMAEKYLKDSNVVRFVELGGIFHYLTIPQSMVFVEPYLKEWFSEYG